MGESVMNTWWVRTTSWAVTVVFCAQFGVGCANKMAKEPSEPGLDQSSIQFTEYTLGAGDVVEVEVYRNDELKRTIVVPGSGIIFYPLVGEIDLRSLGVTELRRIIQDKLKNRIADPQVSLSVKTVRSHKVYVLGEVKAPSVFTMEGQMRASEVISKAGGFTDNANSSSVILVRNKNGKADLHRLNLDEFFEGIKLGANALLQPGDVLYVPRTFVADMDAFFAHVFKALIPVLFLEQAITLGPLVRDAITGVSGKSTQTIIIAPAVQP
jgi:polysaccharide biosynthesis/export protein